MLIAYWKVSPLNPLPQRDRLEMLQFPRLTLPSAFVSSYALTVHGSQFWGVWSAWYSSHIGVWKEATGSQPVTSLRGYIMPMGVSAESTIYRR